MESFSCGRDFAAWLGLVPRQFSSGGKERLGRTSKAGQADIRRLLIIGAMSRLNWMGRKSIPDDSWLARMVARKPRRSEEHTSELQSLMRISYAVFCLKKNKNLKHKVYNRI